MFSLMAILLTVVGMAALWATTYGAWMRNVVVQEYQGRVKLTFWVAGLICFIVGFIGLRP